MKTKSFSTLFLILLTIFSCMNSALALNQTNCSSSDGGLMRMEEEIWGANRIYWNYQEKALPPEEIIILDSSKKILTVEKVRWMGVESSRTSYTMTIKTPDNLSHDVLCEEIANDAID